MLMVHFDSYFKCSSISLTLFHMGAGADFTCLQIVFFITSGCSRTTESSDFFKKFTVLGAFVLTLNWEPAAFFCKSDADLAY